MNKKNNFFKSFWYAITNFEKYKEFVNLKSWEVVKYVVIFLFIFSLLITVAVAFPITNKVNSGFKYFEQDFPELNYAEGKLFVDSESPIFLQDEKLDAIILVDTNVDLEGQNRYIDEQVEHVTSILIFDDKLVIKTPALNSYTTYDYTEIQENFGFKTFDKQSILEKFAGNNIFKIYVSIYLFLFAYMLLTYSVVLFMDLVVLSILAFLTSKLYKVGLRYGSCLKIAVFALTLPLVLQFLYILVNTFSGFTIQYFTLMYDIISYIYIITAILIMKNDMAKQDVGLIKEVKIENKEEEPITNEEIEEEKKKKNTKKENKKKQEEGKIPNDVEPDNV